MHPVNILIRLCKCVGRSESWLGAHAQRYVSDVTTQIPCQPANNPHTVVDPAHDKTYNKTCATNKDSDQPAHPHSLIESLLIACAFYCRRAIKREINETFITKTYLYNFDPLKPHFYMAKLGFTGVYIIFLISAQKHRLWVPRRF